MRTIIRNGTILTPELRLSDHALSIEAGQIQQVLPGQQGDLSGLSGIEVIDAGGLTIIPGLIDIHTYGCLGARLTEPESARDDLIQLSRNYAKFGVTGFLISPPMSEMPRLVDMVRSIAEAIPATNYAGAACLGIHLEGPYLNPAKKGAFPVEYLKTPTLQEIEQLLDAASGWLKIVTMAPELEGVPEAARILSARGVRVSLGHSNLPYDRASGYLKTNGGFSLVTHIFNAMTPFQHREPGVVGASMLSEAPLMLICDGEHVMPPAVRLLVKACGVDRIILVTDSNSGAGLGDGEVELNDQRIYIRNGRATLADGTLAGSVLTQNQSILRVRSFAGLRGMDAVKMATTNPAHVLGFSTKGFIKPGADADLVVMDEESGLVRFTMVGGRVVSQDPILHPG